MKKDKYISDEDIMSFDARYEQLGLRWDIIFKKLPPLSDLNYRLNKTLEFLSNGDLKNATKNYTRMYTVYNFDPETKLISDNVAVLNGCLKDHAFFTFFYITRESQVNYLKSL